MGSLYRAILLDMVRDRARGAGSAPVGLGSPGESSILKCGKGGIRAPRAVRVAADRDVARERWIFLFLSLRRAGLGRQRPSSGVAAACMSLGAFILLLVMFVMTAIVAREQASDYTPVYNGTVKAEGDP